MFQLKHSNIWESNANHIVFKEGQVLTAHCFSNPNSRCNKQNSTFHCSCRWPTFNQVFTLAVFLKNPIRKHCIFHIYNSNKLSSLTFSPLCSFNSSVLRHRVWMGSLSRADPIKSSKYSSMPSSCSVCPFGFIIEICSTSPLEKNSLFIYTYHFFFGGGRRAAKRNKIMQ